jgi:predicted nucleic acid-binding protein
MTCVYFDTSVFLALFGGDQAHGPHIKGLLRELKQDRIRIYTSILTVQEVSVLSFRRGALVADNHTKVARLARVLGITKEIALTAAKYEAAVKDQAVAGGEDETEQNRRRKWDCFHLATAVAFNCRTLYAFDQQYHAKQRLLGLQTAINISEPMATKLGLPFAEDPRPGSPLGV